MKKEYIKPEILVEEFISDIYMQSASPGDNETEVKPEIGPPGEWTNDRRGSWGNLWD